MLDKDINEEVDRKSTSSVLNFSFESTNEINKGVYLQIIYMT